VHRLTQERPERLRRWSSSFSQGKTLSRFGAPTVEDSDKRLRRRAELDALSSDQPGMANGPRSGHVEWLNAARIHAGEMGGGVVAEVVAAAHESEF
jgi:hypothetical protein